MIVQALQKNGEIVAMTGDGEWKYFNLSNADANML